MRQLVTHLRQAFFLAWWFVWLMLGPFLFASLYPNKASSHPISTNFTIKDYQPSSTSQ